MQLTCFQTLDERYTSNVHKEEIQITHMGEEYEMLKARIQMGLLLKTHNFLKMGVINMCIYTKETFEYRLDNILEVRWKRCTYKNIAQLTMRKGNIVLSEQRKQLILVS